MSSCKRDHVCSCEIDGTVDSFTIDSSTLSDAEEECAAQDELVSLYGGSCELE